MTQDERFLKSIHIVPDLAPVGKRTRETSREWTEPTPETDYAQFIAESGIQQVSGTYCPGLSPILTPLPTESDDAHPFAVALDYAEWIAVAAAIESTVAKMDVSVPAAAAVGARLYQAYIKILAGAVGR